MTRLSSDYLFHYKADFEVVKAILQNGFRHSLWSESLPYKHYEQHNFLCSFCDILPWQASYHRKCYGQYAIALTKEWGIRSGISPVRYLHDGSPGVSDEYIALKNLNRKAGEERNNGIVTYLQAYLLMSKMQDDGVLKLGVGTTLLEDLCFESKQAEEIATFNTFVSGLPNDDSRLCFYNYLNVFLNRIIKLNNELEKRDAFCRVYKGDFEHPISGLTPGKILYDEREWRSIRMIEESIDGSHVKKREMAHRDKFLPPEFNLKFTDDDLQYIIVENDSEISDIQRFIETNVCLVSPSARAKIVTFESLLGLT